MGDIAGGRIEALEKRVDVLERVVDWLKEALDCAAELAEEPIRETEPGDRGALLEKRLREVAHLCRGSMTRLPDLAGEREEGQNL